MTNERHPWIGVDLDGTQAVYRGWIGPEDIGPPIGLMVNRVKRWLDAGLLVKVFTARASDQLAVQAIQRWCLDVYGQVLPVTATKDYDMVALYDDRAVAVEENTGRILGGGFEAP